MDKEEIIQIGEESRLHSHHQIFSDLIQKEFQIQKKLIQSREELSDLFHHAMLDTNPYSSNPKGMDQLQRQIELAKLKVTKAHDELMEILKEKEKINRNSF